MLLQQWLDNMRKKLADFEYTWEVKQDREPELYMLDIDEGEWNEQFDWFCEM